MTSPPPPTDLDALSGLLERMKRGGGAGPPVDMIKSTQDVFAVLPSIIAELTRARSDLAAKERRIERQNNALRDCVVTMEHAAVFVTSRQRIKEPEGSDLYFTALNNARATLEDRS